MIQQQEKIGRSKHDESMQGYDKGGSEMDFGMFQLGDSRSRGAVLVGAVRVADTPQLSTLGAKTRIWSKAAVAVPSHGSSGSGAMTRYCMT